MTVNKECVYKQTFKDGLSIKIKKIHIHLYFIATKYLQDKIR